MATNQESPKIFSVINNAGKCMIYNTRLLGRAERQLYKIKKHILVVTFKRLRPWSIQEDSPVLSAFL